MTVATFADDLELVAADGPAWLAPVRERALGRFRALGFPTTRDEDWKYTSTAPISEADWLLLREPGGEKKRNEILQMAVLEPKLAILDETDSGLDIDALRIVAEGVNKLRSADNAIILVTHYQRLLNFIVPDVVHVLAGGKIVKEGGKELAFELEEKGYDWVKTAANRQ